MTNIPPSSSKVKWKRRRKEKKKIGEEVGGQCAIYRERNEASNELPCWNIRTSVGAEEERGEPRRQEIGGSAIRNAAI